MIPTFGQVVLGAYGGSHHTLEVFGEGQCRDGIALRRNKQ